MWSHNFYPILWPLIPKVLSFLETHQTIQSKWNKFNQWCFSDLIRHS
jgi:hypothetical protein